MHLLWFWPGSPGDPGYRGKCCSGPRCSKQVLCQHALAGQGGRIGILEQPSGARQRSEKVQERHRQLAVDVRGGAGKTREDHGLERPPAPRHCCGHGGVIHLRVEVLQCIYGLKPVAAVR